MKREIVLGKYTTQNLSTPMLPMQRGRATWAKPALEGVYEEMLSLE